MNKKMLQTAIIGLTALGCWGISEIVPDSPTVIMAQAKRVTISKAKFRQDMTVAKKAISQSGSISIKKHYNAKVIKKMYQHPYDAYYTIDKLLNSLEHVADVAYNMAGDPDWSTARINQTIKLAVNSQALIFEQFKSRLAPKPAQKLAQLLTVIRQNGVYFDDNVDSKTQEHIGHFEFNLDVQFERMTIVSVAGHKL